MVYYPPGTLKPPNSSALFNLSPRCRGCGRQVKVTAYCTGLYKDGSIGFRPLCNSCARRESYAD